MLTCADIKEIVGLLARYHRGDTPLFEKKQISARLLELGVDPSSPL